MNKTRWALLSGSAAFACVAIFFSCGDTLNQNDGGYQGDAGGPDAMSDGSYGDAAAADSGTDASVQDAGADAALEDAAADGGVPQDSGAADAAVDAGTDAGPVDGAVQDGGQGDGGSEDGSVKISKFGFVNISFSEGVASSTGTSNGMFYGYYKPGKSGGGGGWIGPDLDDCVIVKPSEPCNPPDCTPPEYQLASVGDVKLSGFVSGPVTLQMCTSKTCYGYYYPEGDPSKAVIPSSEFNFDSEYGVDGDGSGEFGAFSTKLVAPKKLKLIKPVECGKPFLPTDSDLLVQWEGGAGGAPIYLTFRVVTFDGVQAKSWSAFCQVINDGEFTIKQKYMVQLPTADVINQQLDISKSVSSKFDIPGMDYGYFTFSVSSYLTCQK